MLIWLILHQILIDLIQFRRWNLLEFHFPDFQLNFWLIEIRFWLIHSIEFQFIDGISWLSIDLIFGMLKRSKLETIYTEMKILLGDNGTPKRLTRLPLLPLGCCFLHLLLLLLLLLLLPRGQATRQVTIPLCPPNAATLRLKQFPNPKMWKMNFVEEIQGYILVCLFDRYFNYLPLFRWF